MATPPEKPLSPQEAKLAEVKRLYPRLTFYYGLDPWQIARLPMWLKEVYLEALPALVAEDQLRAMEASSIPHMEDNARQMAGKRWRSQIPWADDNDSAAKPSSHEEMAMLAGATGIAFVIEPGKHSDAVEEPAEAPAEGK